MMSTDRSIIKESEDLQVWVGNTCHSFDLEKLAGKKGRKKDKCCKKFKKGKTCKKCPRINIS